MSDEPELQQGAPGPDQAEDRGTLDAALADAQDLGLADPGEGAPGLVPAKAERQVPTKDLIVPLVDLVGGALEATGHFERRFIADEIDKLAEAYAVVLDKWFPDMNWGPEFTAALVTLGVVIPIWKKAPPEQDAGDDRTEKKPAVSQQQDRTLEAARQVEQGSTGE